MASTPSTSALSAVLRCRGNIWARNPPTKRPATAAYGLGPAPPAERNRASAWEAFLHGERVVVGGRLAVACGSTRPDGKMLRRDLFRGSDKPYNPKVSHSPRVARSGDALVRRLARKLTSDPRGADKRARIVRMVKCETRDAHTCKTTVPLRGVGEFPVGVLNVSVTSPRFRDDAARLPPLFSSGWSTLRSTCLSLAALATELVRLRLALLWGSSGRGPRRLPRHRVEEATTEDALQANGQIHSPTALTSSKDNSGCGQKITEDTPD